MVKAVKMPLRKVLGRSLLTVNELTTVVAEVESIVNDRLLSHGSDDFQDQPAITPGMLIRRSDRRRTIRYAYSMTKHSSPGDLSICKE